MKDIQELVNELETKCKDNGVEFLLQIRFSDNKIIHSISRDFILDDSTLFNQIQKKQLRG